MSLSKIGAAPENIGIIGEKLASDFLKKQKYKICVKNERPDGHEEIDLVVETRTERVFVEVKTRTGDPQDEWNYGRPVSAVTHEKRRHLLNAARAYNTAHPTKKITRMDVVEVYLSKTGDEPTIRHIIDAFRT